MIIYDILLILQYQVSTTVMDLIVVFCIVGLSCLYLCSHCCDFMLLPNFWWIKIHVKVGVQCDRLASDRRRRTSVELSWKYLRLRRRSAHDDLGHFNAVNVHLVRLYDASQRHRVARVYLRQLILVWICVLIFEIVPIAFAVFVYRLRHLRKMFLNIGFCCGASSIGPLHTGWDRNFFCEFRQIIRHISITARHDT